MSPAAPNGHRRPDARDNALTWGVALVTIAAPAAVGGAHPTTQVVLSAVALGLLIAYVAMRGKRGLRPVPFATAALVALGFTVLQLLPLPAAIVGLLSPHAHEIHADVAPGAHLMPLSVDTPATWLACARAIGCVSLLLVVAGFVHSRRHAARLLTLVAATAAGLAVVAAVQRLAGTSTILGFYHPRSPPGFGVFGTFVDVNHAASLLSLGSLVAVGLTVEASGRKRSLYVMLAVLSTCALFFTTSRGAMLGFAIGAFLLTTVLAARSVGIARAIVGASVLLLVGMTTVLWINEGLRSRITSRSQLVDSQKTRGWADGMRLAAAYRWTGAGRGAFEAAIGGYRNNDEGVRLAYPENIVVQMASEWGIPLTLVLMALVLTTSARLLPAVARASPSLVGGACGVVAVVVHDLMDFGLELPGVAFPTMVVLATVVGRVASNERQQAPSGYRVPVALSASVAGVAALMLVGAAFVSRHSLDADFARLHAGAEAHAIDERALFAAIARHPADDYLELLAAQQGYEHKRPDAMHHVNRALRLHPANWQAHRLAALMLVSMSRPAQAALEYRLALENGMNLNPSELGRMLSLHVVDAVPQTPAHLMELARGLYGIGRTAEGDAAAQRAVDQSESRQPMLMVRTQLALDANAPKVLAAAAHALLAEAETPEAFALAARALSRLGSSKEANAAVEAGLKRHPADGSLFLVGAELQLAAGDLAGARATLGRAGKVPLTLPERGRAEELLAEVAERSGDVESAMLARARSRLIAKQLQDMTLSEKVN